LSDLIAPGAVKHPDIITAAVVADDAEAQAHSSSTAAEPPAYWLLVDNKPQGPLAAEDVRVRLATGRLDRGTLGCPVGATSWRPIGELLGIGITPAAAKGGPSGQPARKGSRLLSWLGGILLLIVLRLLLRAATTWPTPAVFLIVSIAGLAAICLFVLGRRLWNRSGEGASAQAAAPSPHAAARSQTPPAGATNDSQWWVSINSRVAGPFSTEAVTRAVATGDFPASTPACPVGGNAWRPLSEWPQLALNHGPH
jgi:hypothetical protein